MNTVLRIDNDEFEKALLNLETLKNDFKSKFSQSNKVNGFLEARDIIYLANLLFIHVLEENHFTTVTKPSFASIYYNTEMKRNNPLSVPAGLQVAIEDCLRRIYVPENYKEDTGFGENEVKPIVSLLSRITTSDNTLVPLTRLRLPEDVASIAIKAYNTKTYLPDDIYFLYASYDRVSFYQFVVLYVEKMMIALRANKRK